MCLNANESVMIVTTPRPRRRISSRTKKRCRNIKNFFHKALNSKSETNNKSNSSLKISISNLKEKISGLETQLDKISKHYYSSTQINDSTDHPTEQILNECKTTSDRTSHRNSNSNETQVLYKATSSKYGKSDCSDNTSRRKQDNIIMLNNESASNRDKTKSKRHKVYDVWQQQDDEFHHYKKSAARHLTNIKNQNANKDKRKKQYPVKDYQQSNKTEKKYIRSHKNEIPRYFEPSTSNNKRDKRNGIILDQDFISNIIKKQYKPTKIFDVQHTNMSQISAPVCRDKEYSMRDNICYDNDLCSCCFDQPRRRDYKRIINGKNVNEMRSVCDTRLYCSKKRTRKPHGHVKGLNDYDNADYYDLIPVKEKSTRVDTSLKPKKITEYKSIAQNKYKEVPPSPRTLRPRLNLQAKVYDERYENSYSNECSSTNVHHKNPIQSESDCTSNNQMKKNNNMRNEMSTLLFENIGPRNENIDKSKQSADTNANFAEIKDLLQSFLTVINQNSTHKDNDKKVPANNGSHLNGLSDTSNSMGNAFPQCNVPPVMPIFPNNCCYPIMPIYPVNYLQNGYLFPNVSNTNNSRPNPISKHPKQCSSMCDYKQNNSNSETHELLKEIHELVTQNPIIVQKKSSRSKRRQHFVTRSVGDSSIASNYNKNDGDAKRCISKSCEALGRGESCNLCSNTSFSDTVLDRFSVEATRSNTDFNPTLQTREIKTNKLKDIFNPWKWGKKKNDALEGISECEDIVEEDIEQRPPPFRQNIANYVMYGQEYYNPPPMKRQPQKVLKQSTPLMSPQFTPRNDARHYSAYFTDQPNTPPHYHNNPQTSPYQRYHPDGPAPQVPLCLKEIEVKSAGTQSERRMSIFKKFAKKIKVESEPSEKKKPPAKVKSGIFNWKTLKENAKTGAIPKDFTFKTQQNLAEGDTKMKNALIKKLFYKRNPFSPRNLIVKTLLGNDPSSYGNPPKLIRPKYFI